MGTTTTKSAVERVFAEYGNRATAADFRAAAREILAERKAAVARAAEALREARAQLHAVPGIRPDLRAQCSRWLRETHGRLRRSVPRATVPGMLRELADLQAAIAWARSPAAYRRAQSLPCGLQDARASELFADEQMARVLPFMIQMEGG